MFKVAENIWIGEGKDEQKTLRYVKQSGTVDCVLVVAQDMTPSYGWEDGVEYMQVGLIDGPGNPLAAYHAAVLSLAAMLRRGRVLVCCHDGGRSLAVAIMYLYLTGAGPSWDEALERLWGADGCRDRDVPRPHDAHRKAFFLMDWGMMKRVLDGEVSD